MSYGKFIGDAVGTLFVLACVGLLGTAAAAIVGLIYLVSWLLS